MFLAYSLVMTFAFAGERDCRAAFVGILKNAGTPVANRENTFENFKVDEVTAELAHDMAQKFVAFDGDESIGLFLSGETGLCKTHLAVATARELFTIHGARMLILTNDNVQAFDQNLNKLWPRPTRWEFLNSYDVIIVDGLGERGTSYVNSVSLYYWAEGALEMSLRSSKRKVLLTSRVGVDDIAHTLFSENVGAKRSFIDKFESVFQASVLITGQSRRPKAKWYR